MLAKKKRDISFDIAKGIGMFLVVMGHVHGMNRTYGVIYSFHMPLFFLISGYFFKLIDKKNFIKKKLKSLILPYLITALIIQILSIVKTALSRGEILTYIIGFLPSIFYGSAYESKFFGVQPVFALWFLLGLFIAECLYYFFCLKRKYTTFFALLCFLGGIWTHQHVILPLTLQPAMCGVLYLHIGHLCKENHWLDNMSLISAVTAVLIWIISRYGELLTYSLDMSGTYYNHTVSSIVASLSASYVVIYFAKMISFHSNNLVTRIFHYWGRYSLVFLSFHVIDQRILNWETVLINLHITNPSIEHYIILLFELMWATCGIIIVLANNYLRKIFGLPPKNN